MTVQELQSTQPITLDGHMPAAALVIIIQRQAQAIRDLQKRVEALETP